MNWIQLLSGAAGAALVAGFFGVIQWWLNRKAQKEDLAAKRQQVDCAARGEEIQDLKKMVGVLMVADRTLLYDRIKHLGKSYIARGYVTIDELEDINTMHSVYHDADKLNGNGFLDNLMKAVHSLPVRAD